MLVGIKCASLATGSYRTVPGRLGPLVIASVMAPLVAVDASNASSKITMKSLVFAAIVVAFVGRVPMTVGAVASALPPVVKLYVGAAVNPIPWLVLTPVPMVSVYFLLVVSVPTVAERTFLPEEVAKEKFVNAVLLAEES